MTPKSLLRLPQAGSRLDDLAYGAWRPVLDDPTAEQRRHGTRVLVCTGKIYYDLLAEAEKMDDHPPIIRVEQLYSFPWTEARAVLAGYPSMEELVWVQEEPRNMGAWTYVEPKLREMAPEGVEVSYVGRPERASPAEGYPAAHIAEQGRIVREALQAAGSKEVPGTVAAAGEGKA
jgi:2-oxoglutarate dehydrogenase E1 component